jgi:hypothetical protein
MGWIVPAIAALIVAFVLVTTLVQIGVLRRCRPRS